MNNSFNFRLLSHLTPKKEGQGFTLVELLVALIIVGVLVAVALPNLLGQVGKAREAEGKNGIGALNRAQQAYHLEKNRFGAPTGGVNSTALPQFDLRSSTNVLGLVLNSRYYNFWFGLTSDGLSGLMNQSVSSHATPINGVNDGIRYFRGSIAYWRGRYASVVCVSDAIDGVVYAEAVIDTSTGVESRSCGTLGSEVK